MDFVYEAWPTRVVFACGAIGATAEELDRIGMARVMVVTTPPQADIAAEFARRIGARASIVYPGAQLNTPTNVTEAALTAVSSVRADGLLAIGDQTAIGLSKAIAARTGLPQLIVPTTFSGAETNPILEELERGALQMSRDVRCLPKAAIYDPEFVRSTAKVFPGPSAIHALANAFQVIAGEGANPISLAMAEEAIRVLNRAAPRALDNLGDGDAWSDSLFSAYLAGTGFGVVGPGLAHWLSRVLSLDYSLDQSEVLCVLLPYQAAAARRTAPAALRRLAAAMEGDDAPSALYDLTRICAPSVGLRAFGLTHAALEKAADVVARRATESRAARRAEALDLLSAAFEGQRP
jgi:maleylacetate reductase